MSTVYLSEPHKYRIVWLPGKGNNCPWFPQYRRFFIWWRYTSTNAGFGTDIHCYPTFKDALTHIVNAQRRADKSKIECDSEGTPA